MESPTRLKFRTKKDAGYRVVPVNGARGAATPQGEIFIDVYHEAPMLPDEITHAVTPDGTLGEIVDQSPEFGMQRTVWIGMALTAEQADNIGSWLQEMAHAVQARTAQIEGPEESIDVPPAQ